MVSTSAAAARGANGSRNRQGWLVVAARLELGNDRRAAQKLALRASSRRSAGQLYCTTARARAYCEISNRAKLSSSIALSCRQRTYAWPLKSTTHFATCSRHADSHGERGHRRAHRASTAISTVARRAPRRRRRRRQHDEQRPRSQGGHPRRRAAVPAPLHGPAGPLAPLPCALPCAAVCR